MRNRWWNSGCSGVICELKVRVHVRGVRRQSGGAVWKSLEGQTSRLEYLIEWVFPLNTIALRVHLLSFASIYKLIPRNAFAVDFKLSTTLTLLVIHQVSSTNNRCFLLSSTLKHVSVKCLTCIRKRMESSHLITAQQLFLHSHLKSFTMGF